MSIKSKHRGLCVAGLAALALAFTVNAVASPTDEPRSITVRFAELDLSKPAGAKVLYSRIKHAASIVCGGHGSPDAYRYYRQCYSDAVTRAVQSINSPLLTAMHGKEITRLAKN
jgi:UrcA family protein